METSPQRSTPRDVFAHLFATIMLIASVVGFTALLFQYVNVGFPDELQPWGFQAASNIARGAMAVLVVVWPVYLFLMRLLARDISADPEKREIKIRKWLFYFTIFAAALAVVIDLVTAVSSFLDGEITLRFALKILSVLLVAGAVFGYYLWDLKRGDIGPSYLPRLAAAAASLAVVAGIVVGFFVMGTPAEQRARRFDEQRIQDLQSIQWQIADYWGKKQVLPASLDDLTDSISGYTAPRDPESKQAYEYRVIEPLKFELCASFARVSDKRYEQSSALYDRPYNSDWDTNWTHGAGRSCFVRTIDPDRYKQLLPAPAPKPVPID